LKLTSESLAAHLNGALLPAYLISGDEPLLAAEAADALRTRARAAGFSEREVHFIERAGDWDAVRASAANLSLFGSRRVLELRLGSARPGTAGNQALLALLRHADPDTLLLVLAPRLDREAQAAEWVKAFESQGGWLAVWPVDVARLPAWLRARSRALGLKLSEGAIDLLAARTEGNLLAAQQELMKLQLLAAGSEDAESVLNGIADSARFDVFQLTDAALAGEAARALRVLAGLRAEGTEATLVLWALAKALRDVWNAHAAGGGRPPAWQRQSAALGQALKRAPQLDFAALAQRAARADRMIKGRLAGNAWDELALLILELCGAARAQPRARAS
jgi:DNA polymerase III subunit delta